MQEFQLVNIKMPDGQEIAARVTTFLRNDINNKTYILYSFDTEELTGANTELNVAIFSEKENSYELIPIETDTEWDAIQEAISKIAKERSESNMITDSIHAISVEIDLNKEIQLRNLQKICEMPNEYIKRFGKESVAESLYIDEENASKSVEDALDNIFSDMGSI